MTKEKRMVVGRFDKLFAIRDLLHCRMLKPDFLAPGVLVVVLLEVPHGVVVLLVGEGRLGERDRVLLSPAGPQLLTDCWLLVCTFMLRG